MDGHKLTESPSPTGDILSGFLHRITGHVTQIGHLLQTVFNIVGTGAVAENNEITRDDFGLHAMIVVVTSTGKVCFDIELK